MKAVKIEIKNKIDTFRETDESCRMKDVVLHIVKSLVGLSSLHAVSFVRVVEDWTWSNVRLVRCVLRSSFVGHAVVPA